MIEFSKLSFFSSCFFNESILFDRIEPKTELNRFKSLSLEKVFDIRFGYIYMVTFGLVTV